MSFLRGLLKIKGCAKLLFMSLMGLLKRCSKTLDSLKLFLLNKWGKRGKLGKSDPDSDEF